MIQGFNIKEQVLGQADSNVYTFDFKIFDVTDLLIYVQDSSGNIVEKIRGDDTTFLSGVTFDSIKGGGTVTLINNLGDEFIMTMFSASDLPDQPTSFPNKTSFTLKAIEGALDYLATLIQRVAWIAQRSMRMHDLDDIDSFDPTLPPNIANYPGGILAVKMDGSGFEILVWNGSTWSSPT
jgi:hypothetical protein